jgi:hypothetical protein
VAQSQLCDRESFYGLKRRRFHVSQRGHLPYIAAASPLLAGAEERMGAAEWSAFAAAQLERWYRPPETEAGAPGLTLAYGADPEEYASHPAGQALPAPPSPAPAAPAQVPPAAGGLLGSIRRSLGFKTPPAPVAAPTAATAQPPARTAGARPPAAPLSPAAPPIPAAAAAPTTEPPRPAAEGFEAEEEIAPGQFYARKKPKFAPP